MTARMMFVHALSPVHAGTGQSLGAIDLAISRDRATGMPSIPGSSIKGALRGRSTRLARKDTVPIFGPETENASDHSGSVAIGDANLLLLPVRSVAGTFAWVTSPFLLARLIRDAKEAGVNKHPHVSEIALLEECRVCTAQTILKVKNDLVVFEDLDLKPTTTSAQHWADFLAPLLFPGDVFWQQALSQRLCIVHDDIMAFLANHAVDVTARIKIDQDKGTVAKGGLWYEENLPAETFLSSMIVAMPTKASKLNARDIFQALDEMTSASIQLGGNATVGRGRCRVLFSGGNTQ